MSLSSYVYSRLLLCGYVAGTLIVNSMLMAAVLWCLHLTWLLTVTFIMSVDIDVESR